MPVMFTLILIANWSAGAGGYNTPHVIARYENYQNCRTQAHALLAMGNSDWRAICLPSN